MCAEELRGRTSRLAGFAVLVLALAGPSAAQDARLFVPADSVAVGDRFSVAMVVERPESAEAIYPDPARGDTMLGDLQILDVTRSTIPASSGFVRDSVVYRVTTFALDSAVVAPQRVLLVANGDTAALASTPQVIPIRSLVPENAEDVRDLAPVVPFRRNPWPWILGGLALLIAAVVGYLLVRRRRRPSEESPPPVPPMPPYEEAIQRLSRLDEYDLSRPSDVKPYYVEVSDILRTYLERRGGYPALESTTRELMRRLEQAQMQGFSSTSVARVRLILERADLVKFADMKPSTVQGQETASETRRVVDEIEQDLRAAEERARAAAATPADT